MSYSPPPNYAHGNLTVAGFLQAFSNSLTYLKNLMGSAAINPATPYRMNSTANADWNSDDANALLWIDHQRRYLHYLGEGKVVSAGDGNETSLSKADTPAVYDLDAIEWLTYGYTYKVTGVTWAFEDWD